MLAVKKLKKKKKKRCNHETLLPMKWPFHLKCDLNIWPPPWQMTLTMVLKKISYHKECMYVYNVKYESFVTYHSKVMTNVNFLPNNPDF